MLESTFLHIPGIGETTETYLWQHGIRHWNEFEKRSGSICLPKRKKDLISKYISLSKECIARQDYHFFSANLPLNQHWRAYSTFRPCFLDIETTGLDKHRNEITLIGLYNGAESKVFINGHNLDEFYEELSKYPVIVSFNGMMFDVPFIKAKYDVPIDQLHIDLRFVLAKLGYKGGLKKIEKELGITRDDSIDGVDGFEAVRLWYRYKKGDQEALKKLVEYNIADIENLKTLMDYAFKASMKRCFSSALPDPQCIKHRANLG